MQVVQPSLNPETEDTSSCMSGQAPSWVSRPDVGRIRHCVVCICVCVCVCVCVCLCMSVRACAYLCVCMNAV